MCVNTFFTFLAVILGSRCASVFVVIVLCILECRECPELVPWCGACPLELTRVVSESERVALRDGVVSLRESRNSVSESSL